MPKAWGRWHIVWMACHANLVFRCYRNYALEEITDPLHMSSAGTRPASVSWSASLYSDSFHVLAVEPPRPSSAKCSESGAMKDSI